MKKMKIDGKEGRFLVEGVDYGDYLEGFFLNTGDVPFVFEGINGPVNGLWRPFRIVLGPNRMMEDIMLCCLNTLSHKYVYSHAVNKMIAIRLVKHKFQQHHFYLAVCGPPVVSESANAA